MSPRGCGSPTIRPDVASTGRSWPGSWPWSGSRAASWPSLSWISQGQDQSPTTRAVAHPSRREAFPLIFKALRCRRRADRVIWAGLGRAPNARKDIPTIIVAFVSGSKRSRRRDSVEKRAEYLAVGVREYWIIDRFAQTLTACRCEGPDVVVPHDRTYRTPLLPWL